MLGKTWNTSSDSAWSGTSSIKVSMYGSMEDRTWGTNVPEIHNKAVNEAMVMAISGWGCQTFTWRKMISFSSLVFFFPDDVSSHESVDAVIRDHCICGHNLLHFPLTCSHICGLGLGQVSDYMVWTELIRHWPSVPVCPSALSMHSTLSRNIWLQYPVYVFHLISYTFNTIL